MKDTRKSLKAIFYATNAKLALVVLACVSFACANEEVESQRATTAAVTSIPDARTELLAQATPSTTALAIEDLNTPPAPIKVNIPAATDKLLAKVMEQFNAELGFAKEESEAGYFYSMNTSQGMFQCFTDRVRMNVWKRDEATMTAQEAAANGNLASLMELNRTGFVMEMRWLDAKDNEQITQEKLGKDRLYQVVNNGGDSKSLSHYRTLLCDKIYAGVDVRYNRMENGAMGYDMILYPQADLNVARFALEGADKVSVAENGNLRIATAIGEMTQTTPLAYQMKGTKKMPVDVSFVVNEDNSIGFKLGAYDNAKPVVIGTTVMDWSVVGTGDSAYGLALSPHPQGGKMLMGAQLLPTIPTKVGTYESNANGGYTNFLVQLSEAGEIKNITYFATK